MASLLLTRLVVDLAGVDELQWVPGAVWAVTGTLGLLGMLLAPFLPGPRR
jgi:hypothetical protein